MKSILVATDFSNDAYCALFYGTKLFKETSCTFYILNVYDELTPLKNKRAPFLSNKNELGEIETQSNTALEKLLHKITLDTENPNHKFIPLSKEGNLSKNIKNATKEYDIDLVLIGSKGETGAKELFFGSNTIQITNTITNCPILAIPKQIDYKAPKEIAFVTDFKQGCSLNNIEPLLFIAKQTNAAIRVMHIIEEASLDAEQELKYKLLENCLKDVKHSFSTMKDFNEKAQVINEFISEREIDLFCMVHQKRSFLEKLMHEPVIKDVSMYANIPFLILPNKE
ncbi:universal stress protein [Cellulophaga sp. Z1A5H]|uniref:universal stress protein n=1 Tax=Cellulophaga sp. Z1A5H TaxID=2687291 RepID=UPI0013FD380C|nr:universal stress protein [Cellulophaga sp. Z1A5H]